MSKPDSCRGCPLYTSGTGFVKPVTPPGARLMLVGEAPGESEARLGVPFSGTSGLFLDRLLKRTDIDRSHVAFHNVLSCRPPGNQLRGMPWAEDAIYRCRRYLDEAIDRVKPQVLVALGDTALGALTERRGIQKHRGFIFLGPRSIPVIPTFHPSYLLPGRTQGELAKDRPTRFTVATLWDLMRAKDMATSGEPFRRLPQRYLVDPSPGSFTEWARGYQNAWTNRGPAVLLTTDIETPGKQAPNPGPILEQPITRISFAFEAGVAVSVPWRFDYEASIRALLGTPGPTTGWNSFGFDLPILEHALGEPPLRGPHYDMMRAWHVLQSDLPKGLEFVASFFSDLLPWKHLSGTEPGLYSATDSDAQIRISYGVREALQPNGQWDLYRDLVMGIAPFLKACGQRGLPVDVEAQTLLEAELTESLKERVLRVQSLVPEALRASKIYVKAPKERPFEAFETRVLIKMCSCGALKPTAVHYRATKTRPACSGTPGLVEGPALRYRALPRDPEGLSLEALQDDIAETGFNPLSLQRVTAYAETYRHLGLLRASGLPTDTLDDTVLGRLEKRFGKDHPLYGEVRAIRELTKKRSTYVLGYKPDARGRIVTTFNDNPSTLRLGSQDVNLQNVHADIKRTIRAPKGWSFVEADSSAIEALMVGLCAQSPSYVRLAAQGVHDFVLAQALGIPWEPPVTLRVTKARENKGARDVKKKTVHLSNFGGTPRTMRLQAPDTYVSEGMAAREQGFYFEVCPEIRDWQNRTRLQVARTGSLVNPWGFTQYFWAVYDGASKGPDFNRCLGAGPQSMAALFMRESLDRLRDSEWAEFACGNVSIHDSIGLLVPSGEAERAANYLLELLTRPVGTLDNLRIGAEAKIGKTGGTWADLQEYRTIRFEDPLLLSSWHRQAS
jgi:uracil-DNA glycosylase family 4